MAAATVLAHRAACLVGGVSGVASVGLVVLVLRTLRAAGAASPALAGLFAALCLVVLATRIGSQLLLTWFTQNSMSQLRLGLCRRILDAPLQHLETIGIHRLLVALTADVATVIRTLQRVPAVVVNLVILTCGTAYLGWLSPGLMLAAVAFALLGMASYWYSSRWAHTDVRRVREAHDGLLKQIRELLEGVKELKMHRPRREVFFEQIVRTETAVREGSFIGAGLFDAAVIWGRLTFFIAIGLLLFAWPRISPTDATTLTGCVLTILYLVSPLEHIMGWLPTLNWAQVAVMKIEQLGLMLDKAEEEPASRVPVPFGEQIELAGVTHAYHPDGRTNGLCSGPST